MKTLRVGTDCSGIESPIQALEKLGIPFKHIFSSDIDKYCIQSIKANYTPEILFGDPDGPYPDGDIQKRDISTVPDIDLYVCGFPCQTFSHAGKRKGFDDKRGNIFWSCLEVIKVKRPKYFILENVKGLLTHDKGKTWKVIWDALSSLEDVSGADPQKSWGYNVQWKVLNTRDYGIPQNRERVFIVGCLRSQHKPSKQEFIWPEKTIMDNVNDYVDNEDNTYRELPPFMIKSKILENIPKDAVFIDTGFQHFNFPRSHLYSPCLLAGHSSNLWCVPKHRLCTVREWLNLQGFQTSFKQSVSNSRLKRQLGNTMSVNVIRSILCNLLY
jgi:DNA (cytosine-5)-methyltransferase 1